MLALHCKLTQANKKIVDKKKKNRGPAEKPSYKRKFYYQKKSRRKKQKKKKTKNLHSLSNNNTPIKDSSTMFFRSIIGSTVRPANVLNTSRLLSTAIPSAATTSPVSALKFTSNGSRDLYAIMKLHNLPYLVTKGDKVYLPYKLKNASIGDVLNITEVTTLGSPSYTLNAKEGIAPELFELKASVVEITREPVYQVVRKKQRCRRKKTFNVEPFQTVLMINELKLK